MEFNTEVKNESGEENQLVLKQENMIVDDLINVNCESSIENIGTDLDELLPSLNDNFIEHCYFQREEKKSEEIFDLNETNQMIVSNEDCFLIKPKEERNLYESTDCSMNENHFISNQSNFTEQPKQNIDLNNQLVVLDNINNIQMSQQDYPDNLQLACLNAPEDMITNELNNKYTVKLEQKEHPTYQILNNNNELDSKEPSSNDLKANHQMTTKPTIIKIPTITLKLIREQSPSKSNIIIINKEKENLIKPKDKKDDKKPCISKGCKNSSITSNDFDEFCSDKCVVNHCRQIFDQWVMQKKRN